MSDYDNLRKDIAKVIDVPEESLVDNFHLRGGATWDSISVLSTIEIINNIFGITIPLEELGSVDHYRDIVALVNKTVND